MNYRHAFHAGNHGDVLKHVILLACLDHLKTKPAAFAALDTHAGRGLYDLTGAEAARSPEWREGAGRVFDWADAPAALDAYRQALGRANPGGGLAAYPGSPALIRAALRPQDRLIACELHEEDARALKALFRRDRQSQVHARDGWAALTALLPFAERRGLILIDPPYEAPSEWARGPGAIAAALARFAGAIIVWWRPLKEASAIDAADADLRMQASGGAPLLRVDFAVAAPVAGAGLAASSLMIVNPPHALAPALRALLPALQAHLQQGAGGFWRIEESRARGP